MGVLPFAVGLFKRALQTHELHHLAHDCCACLAQVRRQLVEAICREIRWLSGVLTFLSALGPGGWHILQPVLELLLVDLEILAGQLEELLAELDLSDVVLLALLDDHEVLVLEVAVHLVLQHCDLPGIQAVIAVRVRASHLGPII